MIPLKLPEWSGGLCAGGLEWAGGLWAEELKCTGGWF